MLLSEGTVSNITYTSDKKGITTRAIVPVSVPKDCVRAIDVSELADDEQQHIAGLVSEYRQYISDIMQTSFKFEDWVEHTTGARIDPMWRSFKVTNIK